MTLPEQDQAFEQVGAAQEGAVGRCCTAHNHVVAAPRARMPTIGHELVRAQTALPRFFINGLRCLHAGVPIGRRVNIDLDHAGVRGDAHHFDTRVVGRGIAFDQDFAPQ